MESDARTAHSEMDALHAIKLLEIVLLVRRAAGSVELDVRHVNRAVRHATQEAKRAQDARQERGSLMASGVKIVRVGSGAMVEVR